ncbi:sideroflexin-4 isoform X2 [Leptonychotes weddellii]|uniref:Sideroflexin-4 isoform X2 n=1 Tax=Leptonychotes weddellii TaxID=9713 RepID=A0A7F8R1L8_LEPWE|nr:sideroflexin-4 isoform X2 [Leptonychotes weddellii]
MLCFFFFSVLSLSSSEEQSLQLCAVKDTATSRVVLFGTSAFIPEVFSHFFVRTQFFRQYPWSLWTFKLSCTVLVMGLMVPVSFSIFPQIERMMSQGHGRR